MLLGHRSAASIKRSASAKSARASARIRTAAKYGVEGLEPRLLLTTLHGGDVLDFINEDGQVEEISVKGNMTAEVIGANVTPSGNTLINLPGTLNGNPVNGGFNIPSGSTVVGALSFTDPKSGAAFTSVDYGPLAADPATGDLYTIAIEPVAAVTGPPAVPAHNEVFLTRINRGTGASINLVDITSQMQALALGAQVTNINAAAFNPANGLLYFQAQINLITGNGTPIFTVNVNSDVVGLLPGNVATRTLGAMCFANKNLLGASGTNIFDISLTNTDIVGLVVNINPAVDDPITGMSTSATLPAGDIFVTTSSGPNPAANAPTNNVYVVSLATGDDVDYGPFGGIPGNITYDTDGNMYGVDTGSKDLVIVSQAFRLRSLSVYQIYISQSDDTGELIEGTYTPVADPGTSSTDAWAGQPGTVAYYEPYDPGLTGGLRIIANNTATNPTVITAPPGIGDAFIGARTVVDPNITDSGYEPIMSIQITDNPLGGFADAPYAIGDTINPGIVSAVGTTIGKIMVAGTIMGEVDLNGACDTFYAGWIITGDANGLPPLDTDSYTSENFYVAGDLRNLVTIAPIGTNDDFNGPANAIGSLVDPEYITGFDMYVGGTLGMVKSSGTIYGNINVEHSPTAPSLATVYTQLQNGWYMYPGNGPGEGYNNAFAEGYLVTNSTANTILRSDTFASAQYLGSIPTSIGGTDSAAVVSGTLYANQSDLNYVDYYAVALLAGQTVSIQLANDDPLEPLNVGVFSPSDQLVASDYNTVDSSQTQGQTFEYTATTPGSYRFAVAENGNTTFADNGPVLVTYPAGPSYTLTIANVGDLAVGGVISENEIIDNVSSANESSFSAGNGDFGALSAVNAFYSDASPMTVSVANGSLRDIDAATIGLDSNSTTTTTTTSGGGTTTTNVALAYSPLLSVPNGSVGLLESTAAGAGIFLNYTNGFALPDPIGGDYQLISAVNGDVSVLAIADGSIGVIRAAHMTSTTSYLYANDKKNPNTAATIDLIDVTGDFGTISDGGPHVNVGPDGNVGYIRVGGNVYSDRAFGGGGGGDTQYQPGEAVTLTDDSGASVVATPTDPTPTSSVTTGSSTTTSYLDVTAYGIEGSGGTVIIKIVSTGGLTINGAGEEAGQTVQIGQIVCNGTGDDLITSTTTSSTTGRTQPNAPGATATASISTTTTTPSGTTYPLPNPPELDPGSSASLNLILNGPARMDVFEVDGGPNYGYRTGNGEFTSIINNTGGDIVNVNAISIGTLETGGYIGTSQSHTGVALNGATLVSNAFPLADQYNAIKSGDIVLVEAGLGVSNLDVTGNIGTIHGAIVGPCLVSASSTETGSVHSVILDGQGVLPSGSGAVSAAGLYCAGQIGLVTNSSSCDIRGAIWSHTGLTGFSLSNASIINAAIGNTTDFADSSAIGGNGAIISYSTPITKPVLDVGPITINGNGGIIGSLFVGEHIGQIAVIGGFGIFSSTISTAGSGTLGGLYADGYGLRGDTFAGGASLVGATANGNGSNIPTSHFSSDVRLSEQDSVDPYFGFVPNRLTDIDVYTGATSANPSVPGHDGGGTDTGVIEDCDFRGSRTLGAVRAYQIRATLPAYPSIFNFANNIGSITTTSSVDGLSIITGRIQTLHLGGDASNLTVQLSGAIRNLTFNGNVLNSSVIQATGINGNIDNLRVGGNMEGQIVAQRRINSAIIYGSLSGTVKAPTIGALKIGSVQSGNLEIAGKINLFQTFGSLGLPGETITFDYGANNIVIGGDINADLVVTGGVKSLKVGGSVISGNSVTVSGVLNSLLVNGNVESGASITAAAIKKQKIKGLVQGVVS